MNLQDTLKFCRENIQDICRAVVNGVPYTSFTFTLKDFDSIDFVEDGNGDVEITGSAFDLYSFAIKVDQTEDDEALRKFLIKVKDETLTVVDYND